MRRCAFLTMDDLTGFHTHDDLVHEPLRALGWDVDNVSWRDRAVDWDRYELVVIRTPWDYQDDPLAFLQALKRIDHSRARLENPLNVVRWNLDKRYLRDLQAHGAAIVPTIWREPGEPIDPATLGAQLATDELVLKPVVSANADHTYRLRIDDDGSALADVFRNRASMAQPFLPSIIDEGEVSVFHFGGAYSHAIVKTPKPGDFRVQEEHGGSLRRIEPDPAIRRAAEAAIAAAPGPLLYARSDFVRHDGDWLLMELELIEPSLYFNLDPDSPARFARCIDGWGVAKSPLRAVPGATPC